jgi:hypothetical protein
LAQKNESFQEQFGKHPKLARLKALFKLDEGKLILEKPNLDAVAIFRKKAKQINYNEKIDPHQYKEELKSRMPTIVLS